MAKKNKTKPAAATAPAPAPAPPTKPLQFQSSFERIALQVFNEKLSGCTFKPIDDYMRLHLSALSPSPELNIEQVKWKKKESHDCRRNTLNTKCFGAGAGPVCVCMAGRSNK